MTDQFPTLEHRASRQAARDGWTALNLVQKQSAHLIFGWHQHDEHDSRDAFAMLYLVEMNKRASSILTLLSTIALDRVHHFQIDFSSARAIARSMLDVYARFYYLCGEEVNEKTRQYRFLIFDVHDAARRLELFAAAESGNYAEVLETYHLRVERLRAHPFFELEPDARKARLEKGYRPPVDGADVATALGVDDQLLRFFYKIFSDAAHAGPLHIHDQHAAWRDRDAAWTHEWASCQRTMLVAQTALAALARQFAAFQPKLYQWAEEWVARCVAAGRDPTQPPEAA